MHVYATTNGFHTTSLVEARSFPVARRALCLRANITLVQLPDREGGWSFDLADAHLFPPDAAKIEALEKCLELEAELPKATVNMIRKALQR